MRYFLLVILVCFGVNLLAQKEDSHFRNKEIGISVAPVYFTPSNELNFGVHVHYVKGLFNGNFGVGLGVEYIFNEGRHQTYGVVFEYSILENLHFIVSPGVAIEIVQGQIESVFALHLEATYGFELKYFSLGPSAEFAYDPHDIHYSIGLHIGIPF